MSATKPSRPFSALVDEVAPRRASECLALLHGRAPVTLDDRFGNDLCDIIAGERPEDRMPWDS